MPDLPQLTEEEKTHLHKYIGEYSQNRGLSGHEMEELLIALFRAMPSPGLALRKALDADAESYVHIEQVSAHRKGEYPDRCEGCR